MSHKSSLASSIFKSVDSETKKYTSRKEYNLRGERRVLRRTRIKESYELSKYGNFALDLVTNTDLSIED